MKTVMSRILGVAIACAAGLGGGNEASAQLFGDGVPCLAPDPTIQPMQGIARVQLGQPGAGADLAAAASGVPSQGNFLNNPMNSAIIYSTMFNNPALFGGSTATTASTLTSTTAATTTAATTAAANNLQMAQLGMLWLMSNQMNGGLGSSRMGATQPASRSRASGDDGIRSRVQIRTNGRPGGLSARYFRRPLGRPSYPKTYFNRRPSAFP